MASRRRVPETRSRSFSHRRVDPAYASARKRAVRTSNLAVAAAVLLVITFVWWYIRVAPPAP